MAGCLRALFQQFEQATISDADFRWSTLRIACAMLENHRIDHSIPALSKDQEASLTALVMKDEQLERLQRMLNETTEAHHSARFMVLHGARDEDAMIATAVEIAEKALRR